MRDEATIRQQLLHKGRQGLQGERTSKGVIAHGAFGKIHLDVVTFSNAVHRLTVGLNQRQPEVEPVPVKDAGKALSQNAGNACAGKGYRRVFPRGAAPEVPFRNQDVSLAALAGKVRINAFHAMQSKSRLIMPGQVPCRYDDIGIYVGTELPHFSTESHVDPLMPSGCG
jgi:hypothetical protein